ncbi:MAG: hypothetical protein J2P46_18205 [Zavarzinella sp.]|nr:hypothetical protein [Zavarzinella sp.]
MDLNNMQMWQYFALSGGGLLVIAIILYFLPAGKLRLPGVVTAGFGGTTLGLALGILLMASFGYKPNRVESSPESEEAANARGKAGPPGGMPKGGMMPGGGMPKGGLGQPPSSKVQLASLVTALDRVADRPVTITLTPDQRQAIAEQLKGLDSADELSETDAKAKLDAIHKIVEKDKDALESVGYRGLSPARKGSGGGGGFGGPKEPPPNPFKSGTAAEHLKSLSDRLAGKK